MSNQTVTDRILEIVRNGKAEAKRAENEFDRRNQDIQWKASRSIDLFGGSATSQVADIARDARRACDDLYASYQSLVRIVDEQCRPLLDQDPAANAVREVRDLIVWLNNESEIENNFTASLNSRSLGDVASARYVPSIDSKMIQRYWENKYTMWPGRAEQEAAAQQAAAERRRADQEAQRKVREQAEKEHAVQMEAYEKENRAWEERKRAIERKINDLVEEAVKNESKRLRETQDKFHQENRERLMKELTTARATKKVAEDELPTLGFFAFGEKARTKKLIETSAAQIDDLNKRLRQEDERYSVQLETNRKKVEEYRKEIRKTVERENPIPAQPRKPVLSVAAPITTATAAIQQAMLDFMVPGELYTVTDFIYQCPECADMTNQRVSAMLRQMVPVNVERIEEQRKCYFRLVDPVLKTQITSGYDRVAAAESRPTATQVANSAIQDAILQAMEPGRLYTITDIMMACPACADLTNLRVSAIVRGMIGISVERIEEKRKAYFRKI